MPPPFPPPPAAAAVGEDEEGEGPPPLGVHWLRRSDDGFRRRGCDRATDGPRFAALAYSRCGDGPMPAWSRAPHAVAVDGARAVCARCGAAVPRGQRARFAGLRCGARVLDGHVDGPDWGARLWRLGGGRVAGGPAGQAPALPAPPVELVGPEGPWPPAPLSRLPTPWALAQRPEGGLAPG